ncbi:MAG: hydrogenase maturation nickel metallochaperone HypA [Rhizobacter sp.]|nr:hydrogenase maturation nickel metallochaperone HypA [Rhizobacter sp.]
MHELGITRSVVEIVGEPTCGAEPLLDLPLRRCPECNAADLRIVAGTELNIKAMEVESCV